LALNVTDPALIPSVAARLDKAGFPLLVWLEPQYTVDGLWGEIGEALYLHDANGNWQKRTRINNTINVFHPRVRQEVCRWLEGVSSALRGDSRILGYELVEESALRFDVSEPNSAKVQARYGGYSRAAVVAFRHRLEQTYASIETLNGKWGTRYGSFAGITPPPLLHRREPSREGPEVALLAAFQEFRAAEHAEYFRQMVAALHRGDPTRPVIPQFTTPLFGDPLGAVDLSRMAEAGWDILSFHTDAAFPYLYSLARYNGRPLWNDEHIWSDRAPRAETSEQALRARAASLLWRNLMWGARGLVRFNRPAFCPERYLVDGHESLSKVRVIVVPVAPYLPETVRQRLADWVEAGGVLVALGPFAIHDEFGHPQAPEPSDANHNKGRHVRVPLQGSVEAIAGAVCDAVDAALSDRAAVATDNRLELMLRALPDSSRLLIVLNGDAQRTVVGQVQVRGEFTQVVDATVDGGIRAKPEHEAGTTVLAVNLEPGEARVFVLR